MTVPAPGELCLGGDTATGLPAAHEAILDILADGPMYSTGIAKQLRTRGFQGWWAQEVGSAMRGLTQLGVAGIAERGAVHLWRLTTAGIAAVQSIEQGET